MNLQEDLISRLKQESKESEFQWLTGILSREARERKTGFVMAHRFIAREPIRSGGLIHPQNTEYPVDLSLWTRDQLARSVILLSLEEGDQEGFHDDINLLFGTADNRESQAIYASIPFFNYPASWKHRATEAIRSNVGLIFDAMAFNNPYPAQYFDDTAWNQLVLKTIFTGKSIWSILGLEARRNHALAVIVSDFAHERWAAGRTLAPEVWFLTSPFPGDRFWQDTYRLLTSDEPGNKEAGYLLWKENKDRAPENFTETFSDLFTTLSQKDIAWKKLT